MRNFEVLVIEILGIRNNTYKGGEIISENCLPLENIDSLIEQGFIKEVTAVAEVEAEQPKPKKSK